MSLPSCTSLSSVFSISLSIPGARYDVSGVSPDKIQKILEQDWVHLLADKRLLDSPNYLREHGRPVVALWGMFFFSKSYVCLV